jgi:ribosomal protein S18 acetylase RimI-like enzyme
MGKDVFAALTHALMNDRIVLEVASTNRRAISLYESLGFIQTAELSRWYKIF